MNRANTLKCKDGESSSSEEEDELNYKTAGEIKPAKGNSLSLNQIPAKRRRAMAKKFKEEENWSSEENEPNISAERQSAMAMKFKEEENGSSEENEPNKSVIEKPPHIIPDNVAGGGRDSVQDKVSTLEGQGSKPGGGSQGYSGMLGPLIFFDYEIHEATNDLSDSSKIREGGRVYKGCIDDTAVAIKMLSEKGCPGITAFHLEIEALGLVRHANLVNLIGTCFQPMALVYEYVPKGSLEDCLKEKPTELTWQIRTNIVYELCAVLRFLHANLPDPLVHGDLKPHNVLLDANFKTKLADFGLSRFLTQEENSTKFHVTKTLLGTLGYIDPDFLESGIVRPAVDVYSFGKTIIRILTRERPSEISAKVHKARKAKNLKTIVDPAAGSWPEEIVELLARFALKCCSYERCDPEFMNKFHTDLGMMLYDIDA